MRAEKKRRSDELKKATMRYATNASTPERHKNGEIKGKG